MKITGTEKIKGVIDLSSVNQQLGRNQFAFIRDDEFWNSDVQTAYKLGFITKEEGNQDEIQVEGDDNTMVECINNHSQPISLSQFNFDLKPGQKFSLKKKDLSDPHIKEALSTKLIVLSYGSSTEEVPETSVSVSKLLSEEPALDTNEELPGPAKVIEDDKNVLWNTKNKEPVNVVEKTDSMIDSDDPDPVNPNEGDPKRQSLVFDPNKTKSQSRKREDDEINFVDKEELDKKRKEHPTMKEENKVDNNNKEVELLSEEKENEERQKSHPKWSDDKEKFEL